MVSRTNHFHCFRCDPPSTYRFSDHHSLRHSLRSGMDLIVAGSAAQVTNLHAIQIARRSPAAWLTPVLKEAKPVNAHVSYEGDSLAGR